MAEILLQDLISVGSSPLEGDRATVSIAGLMFHSRETGTVWRNARRTAEQQPEQERKNCLATVHSAKAEAADARARARASR